MSLSLSFEDCKESFRGGALQIEIQEVFEFYVESIQSFSLGRYQGCLSKRLDEGNCSDGSSAPSTAFCATVGIVWRGVKGI